MGNHIKPGDALVRSKFGFWGFFFDHWALYVSDEPPEVIERQDIGIRQITFERFHKDLPYKVIPYKGSDEEREEIVNRALELKDDKTFEPLTKNCETFVRYSQTGKRKSIQIRMYLALLISAFIYIVSVILSLLL